MNDKPKRIENTLRQCDHGDCTDCDYRSDEQTCQEAMQRDAADEIERLRAENTALKNEIARIGQGRGMVHIDHVETLNL